MGIFRIQAYFFALIIALFFVACDSGENFKALNNDKTYNFAYNGFEKSLKLNDKAQNFALVFFTKDCGVCKEQIPILQNLAKNYDFNIFVVLGDANDANDAKAWADEKGLSNLAMFYEKRAAKYLSSAIGEIYGVPVLSFFKEGKMDEKFIGLTPYSILEKEIKKVKS
ncbi:TPA: conjugal transfer protein TraF [Campylobacter jejuni]|uniref:TlpA family protein disulfide reductase n=1 Tax=Campylobacter TaxID=194 RepID=UPI0005CEBBFA|nr:MULTISPECIES: conjugal transfer protein TraF [Campylobacter]EAL7651526.1 thioredoxin [Campylobacter jejuni]EDO8476735.1 redoxin domain-containing protein [Campylobacter jejuni]EGD0207375.1 redoxin domain-containing protein [Campylobacter jejuni]EJQ3999511.1 conjugal transfer protein TraF [Campylobacter jejuni]KJD25695.1 thioredoxin [Campylobacter jejuni subsp. jejuni]